MPRTPFADFAAPLLACATVLVLAASVHAQSGPYTEEKCVELLMEPVEADVEESEMSDEQKAIEPLRVPSTDLNQDGTISREEALKVCSGAGDSVTEPEKS
ncbi:MAG: hypothetical protein AAFQ42_11700 [Pseudomonadota bacterium]